LAKITLDSVISGFKSVTRLVSNFSKIEDSLNNDVLWRDNPEGEPNQMEDDLDMNTNRITNLPSPVNDTDAVRWVDVKDGVSGVNEVVPSQSGNEKVALTTNGTSLVFGAVDSDNVDFLQAGTGAVATDVQSKLRETVSVKDFGAVGDGVTDDTAAIQAALDTNKGVVDVPDGTYYVGSSTLVLNPNQTIRGAGLLSKFTIDSSARTPTQSVIECASGCGVIGLVIDGDRSNAIQQFASVSVINGVTDIVLKNLTLQNHGTGVNIGYSDNTKITNCTFSGTLNKNHIVTQGSVGGNASNIVVLGNRFDTTVEEAIDVNAKTNSMLISSNTFFNNHTGPDLDGTEVIDIGSDSDCSDIVITGNTFDGSNSPDAFVWIKQGSSYVTVSNNVMKNTKLTSLVGAVRISNSTSIVVSENSLKSAGSLVSVSEDSYLTASGDIAVTSNVCSDLRYIGVRLDNCTGVTSNVVISANTLESSSSSSQGIYIIEGDCISIGDNIVSGFTGDGISLGSLAVNAIVTGNTVKGANDGIKSDSASASILGNNVLNSIRYGVHILGVSNIITNNKITGSSDHGIALVGADNALLTANTVTGNSNAGIRVASVTLDAIVSLNILSNNTSGGISGGTNLQGLSLNLNNIS